MIYIRLNLIGPVLIYILNHAYRVLFSSHLVWLP